MLVPVICANNHRIHMPDHPSGLDDFFNPAGCGELAHRQIIGPNVCYPRAEYSHRIERHFCDTEG
jgi:hypothetical protein